MKRFKVFVCILIILIMGIVGYGCDANINDATYYNLSNVIVGEKFDIVMDASTGPYSWEYEINNDAGIEFVTMEFVRPIDHDQNILGGGKVIYTFLASKKGNYEIKFTLQEAWSSASPIETIIYKVITVR